MIEYVYRRHVYIHKLLVIFNTFPDTHRVLIVAQKHVHWSFVCPSAAHPAPAVVPSGIAVALSAGSPMPRRTVHSHHIPHSPHGPRSSHSPHHHRMHQNHHIHHSHHMRHSHCRLRNNHR